MQKYPNWLSKISRDLAGVPGVIGIVLGGSYARGKGKKDSDFDLGIYYQSKNFDWEKVVKIAKNYDDNHQPEVFGAPGTCGPWINGGIWLTVKKKKVDFLLRDYDFVWSIISDCEKGIFSSNYQPGYPNAFHSYILMSEVYFNFLLFDKQEKLSKIYALTKTYPPKLKKAIIKKFSFEAAFALDIIKLKKNRDDPYYLSGLVFWFISALIQIIYALNECYFFQEKGSVEEAATFPLLPKNWIKRVKNIISVPPVKERDNWIFEIENIWKETEVFLR